METPRDPTPSLPFEGPASQSSKCHGDSCCEDRAGGRPCFPKQAAPRAFLEGQQQQRCAPCLCTVSAQLSHPDPTGWWQLASQDPQERKVSKQARASLVPCQQSTQKTPVAPTGMGISPHQQASSLQTLARCPLIQVILDTTQR